MTGLVAGIRKLFANVKRQKKIEAETQYPPSLVQSACSIRPEIAEAMAETFGRYGESIERAQHNPELADNLNRQHQKLVNKDRMMGLKIKRSDRGKR